MDSKLHNGHDNKNDESVYVLDGCTPEDVASSMIVKGEQKEPFHLEDLDGMYRRICYFKKVLPRAQIFYAMKSNSRDLLLRMAVSQGTGFDCASPGEIYKILQLNVNPRAIIYAVPNKTPEQMMYARKVGVKYTTFDSSYELIKLKQYWPDSRLLIRIKVESDSVYRLGDKFGCNFDTDAIDLLDQAASLELKVVGVAFHVGCLCSSIESFVVAIQQARALFDHEMGAGRKMTILDIGGGFLVPKENSIDPAAKLINEALEKYFPDPSIQVIAEPGGYLNVSTATLYSRICNIRRYIKDKKPINNLYIDDGVYGTLLHCETWCTVEVFKPKKDIVENTEELEEVVLWGPSCSSFDRVMSDHTILLPRLKPADWLVLPIRGSYSHAHSSNFSCISLPTFRTVISLDLWLKIKDHPIFSDIEFILNPDLSTPLPLSLPPEPSPHNESDYITTELLG